MHWVFVLEKLGGRGGVETVMRMVSHEIERSGDSVCVYLPVPSGETAWEQDLPEVVYYDPVLQNVRYATMHMGWRRVLGLRRQVELRQPPDVVVAAHVPWTAFYSRMALGYRGAPLVSWLHNIPEAFLDPEYIQYADLHWAVSAGTAEKVRAQVKNGRRVVLVRSPVRIDVPPIAQTSQKDPAEFLYIGRLANEQKRVDLCLKALAMVDRPWRLDVYGDGPDAPDLRELAQELGIDARCTWHGWTDDPWQAVARASALLVTSQHEGLCLVAGEALARRVPVVSSDSAGGAIELVRHGENGLIFPKGDAEALASALTEAIDEGLFGSLSAQAGIGLEEVSVESVVRRMRASLGYLHPDVRGGLR